MVTRRDWEIALAAALAVSVTGCAGRSILNPWSGRSSTAGSAATSVEDLAKHQPKQPSALEKAADSIADALTIEPKVIPPTDPTSLSSKPKKLDAEVFVRAARIHESRGNFAAAEAQYKKGLEVEPNDQSALVGLARLYDRQEHFAEAEKLYKQATSIDPNSALVWNDLGLCYARQKRFDDAVATLNTAIRLQPQNKMYRNNAATVLMEAGRHDEAWSHLSAVSEPAVAHYNMAYLLHQRRHDQLAMQHLEMALASDPSLAPAEQLLAQIRDQHHDAYPSVVEGPRPGASSFSISDEGAAAPPVMSHAPAVESPSSVAAGPMLVNPLIPATRRAATYRMPPTEEQSHDPAPSPERLPQIMPSEAAAAEDPADLELTFPARRISHDEDASEIKQPKNIIRLLGGEPESAPIPADE